MRDQGPQNSPSVSKRPLVVLGSEGFIGSHLMALGARRAVGVGIDRSCGQSAHDIQRAICDIPNPPIVVHAAGSVSKTGAPCERAYLKSTADPFSAVSAVQPRATVITFGSIIEKLDAQTPYAEVKRQQRALAAEAANQFGIHWVHVRLHNPIGPSQSSTQAAGAMARRLLNAMQEDDPVLRVRGARAVRDWIDVRDVCRMVVSIAENIDPADSGEDIEVCTGTGHTVLALATAIVNASGAEIKIVEDEPIQATPVLCPSAHHSSGVNPLQNVNPSSRDDAVIGDTTYLRRAIGAAARPCYSLERSMRDLWDALLVSERRGV